MRDYEYGHDNLTTIKAHRQTVHNIASDVKCEKCGKVFAQKNKLTDHEIICGHEFKTISVNTVTRAIALPVASGSILRQIMQHQAKIPKLYHVQY